MLSKSPLLRSHQQLGLPLQDFQSIFHNNDGLLIKAVVYIDLEGYDHIEGWYPASQKLIRVTPEKKKVSQLETET